MSKRWFSISFSTSIKSLNFVFWNVSFCWRGKPLGFDLQPLWMVRKKRKMNSSTCLDDRRLRNSGFLSNRSSFVADLISPSKGALGILIPKCICLIVWFMCALSKTLGFINVRGEIFLEFVILVFLRSSHGPQIGDFLNCYLLVHTRSWGLFMSSEDWVFPWIGVLFLSYSFCKICLLSSIGLLDKEMGKNK